MSLILFLWFNGCLFALLYQVFTRAVRMLMALLHSCQNLCGFIATKLVKSYMFFFYINSRVLQSGPGDLELAHR